MAETIVGFPDAVVGESKYYGIDCDAWLTNENDTLSSVTWTLGNGITNEDEVLDAINNIAYVKISTSNVGTYLVTATITSIEGTKTQTNKQKFSITVY